jgi:hypothetical protein
MLRRLLDRATRGSVIRRLRHEGVYARLDSLEGHVERLASQIEALAARTAPSADKHRLLYSGRLGDRAMTVLALLSPEDPLDAPLVRLGRRHDGGYVLAAPLLTGGVAYSFGIGNDASWDLAMAAYGYQIFQYDHTVDRPPESHPNFHFSKLGVGATDNRLDFLSSLEQLIVGNGHDAETNIVLKMDVEGVEWDVFSTMKTGLLDLFSQIVVEFHWLDQLDDDAFYNKVLRSLRALREEFVPIHVHGNNHCDLVTLGGVPVPQLLEVTYVRRGSIRTAPGTRTFPTALDQPNHADRPDLYLGTFQFPR